MAGLSLQEAARRAGVSRTTIWRAISAGRLRARRDAEGGFSIEPADLHRIYPPGGARTGKAVAEARPPRGEPEREAEAAETVALRLRLATAETRVAALEEMVAELRHSREQWQQQAERATLALAALSRTA
ncbi:hypothetical protein [Methylobacterium sp. ID0610]|uniref:hypothetical protein n=1 Tax=Methylobacterium carpenticola TaxID=3344827 RepID=UPI0036BDD6A6